MKLRNRKAARRSEAWSVQRRAFTLVELLVVITIIGLLAGLLLPAINGAVRSAKEAAVASEISLLDQALASFKTRYGEYPPSFIVLDESGLYANNPAVVNAVRTHFQTVGGITNPVQLETQTTKAIQRSERYLKRFFNRMGSTPQNIDGDVDNNGNDIFNKYWILEGDECLVFFLGGIPRQSDSTTFELTGFCKRPDAPLYGRNENKKPTLNRENPIFEFKAERLVDFDGDGFPSYIDTLGTDEHSRPYVYFSAYGANAYDAQDCNINPSARNYFPSLSDIVDLDSGQNYFRQFGGASGASISPNPYTTGPAFPTGRSPAWQKPQSYQIISAGVDRVYGFGGQFAGKTKSEPLPMDAADLSVPRVNPASSSGRFVEFDNITNFSQGRLN